MMEMKKNAKVTPDNFINHFANQGTIDTFTSGCCYWFAFILHERFKGSEIMYDPVINHFGTKINGRIYDITGDITDKYNFIVWDEYIEDGLERQRIIDCCIDFTRG